MKLWALILAALAALAVAGAASASIPGDGGYTDGLRVVYPTPITARSVPVHERYTRCRAGEHDTRDHGEVVPLHAARAPAAARDAAHDRAAGRDPLRPARGLDAALSRPASAGRLCRGFAARRWAALPPGRLLHAAIA